jgi:putative transposase
VVARPLRIVYPGALYHLITRGNARQWIYRDDSDRQLHLGLLEHTVERYGVRCHTYCLMGNHYHLVVETAQPNLPVAMRHFNGLYARHFNDRYNRCGHLFQARYRSILIESDEYLLNVCRYVVLNPVRAGICTHPADYRWSSYRAIAGLEQAPSFLTLDRVLNYFDGRRDVAQLRWQRFVEAGIAEALRIRGERVGSEHFLRDTFGYKPPLPEIPRNHIQPLRRDLNDIFATEQLPVATAYREHGYTLTEIATHLDRHYSTISRQLKRQEAMLQRKT